MYGQGKASGASGRAAARRGEAGIRKRAALSRAHGREGRKARGYPHRRRPSVPAVYGKNGFARHVPLWTVCRAEKGHCAHSGLQRHDRQAHRIRLHAERHRRMDGNDGAHAHRRRGGRKQHRAGVLRLRPVHGRSRRASGRGAHRRDDGADVQRQHAAPDHDDAGAGHDASVLHAELRAVSGRNAGKDAH